MRYYHFCTEGLKKGIIFRDSEDYIVGMNYIAITARECGIIILAFCLMSNHWHFIVSGNLGDIEKFNTLLKKRISMWLHRKYNVFHYLKGQALTIKEIDNMDYLKKVIGYVLRNPIVAGINCTIESYRWGSGACYFFKDTVTKDSDSKHSSRSKRIICKSNSSERNQFILDGTGMIDPSQYVDSKSVLELFRTAKSFIYNVMGFKSFDMDIELESGLAHKISVEDSKLISIVDTLCRQEHGIKSVDLLPITDKCKIAVRLRNQYGATNKQIARILGLDVNVIELLK